ncbi:M23 family metallopeptidase [uncultured Enterovirga sp.]|uniref:M23 family metallopeptidase n=1 Tax=uncultured Enterovirga sp. TaxID=2026352 RepID=UPI0035CC71C4
MPPNQPSERPVRPPPSSGQIVLRRKTLLVSTALTALTLAWAGAATWYIASRDELAIRFFAAETELRYTYEDRISDLKGRLEREITHNLVERNGFAARAEALARRQVEIESRQSWLSGLAERMLGRETTAALPDLPGRPMAAGDPRPTLPVEAGVKPAPITEPFGLRPTSSPGPETGAVRPPDRLTAVERSLERSSAQAVRMADLFRRAAEERASRLRLALDATGLDLRRLSGPREAAVGGPLVPVPSGFVSPIFGSVMSGVDAGLGEFERLHATARTLPLGRPVAALEPTSGFGYRVDPFTRTPALHTGLDFRAETGSPVRVTAAGRVVTADYVAGYGNLIEVDHGNGVATRYGHLSGFLVTPGATVEAGQLVGRAGSTGRSTGPHLHYEVRIEGEPVNPARFLEAGRLLASSATPEQR